MRVCKEWRELFSDEDFWPHTVFVTDDRALMNVFMSTLVLFESKKTRLQVAHRYHSRFSQAVSLLHTLQHIPVLVYLCATLVILCLTAFKLALQSYMTLITLLQLLLTALLGTILRFRSTLMFLPSGKAAEIIQFVTLFDYSPRLAFREKRALSFTISWQLSRILLKLSLLPLLASSALPKGSLAFYACGDLLRVLLVFVTHVKE